MPASKPDREAVKVLAIAVGVREAARQLGLNEARVLQWSKRGEWFKTPPQPPSQGDVITVISPSAALQDTLSNYSKRSKLALAKAGTKAAEHLAQEEVTAKEVLKQARQMKDVAGTLQTVLGWNEGKAGSGTLNLNILGGQSAIQVVQSPQSE